MLNLGTFTLPRLNAHRVVLAAAALTTLVAEALATILVVFSDQALPHTVRQRLTAASGTSMIVARPHRQYERGRLYRRAGGAHRGRGGRGNATAPPS
jgi:hypothetical protein